MKSVEEKNNLNIVLNSCVKEIEKVLNDLELPINKI